MIKKFITERGTIIPAVTAEQMIEIDRITINETGPNLFQMMENAGRNLAELTIKVLGEGWKKKNIIVLAGTGGNGGGGICAARHLSNRSGNITVCITDTAKLKDVSAYQLHVLKTTDTKIISIQKLNEEKPDLILDAILGYNLTGEPKGKVLESIKWTTNQSCFKISLDVPTGIDATTGEHSKYFIEPNITLTLALPKTGLLPELTGELYLGDIGITKIIYKTIELKLGDIFTNQFITKIRAAP